MVSIITLNYNQNDYSLKCVDSILKSEYDDFQIMLIDNGSTIENFNSLKAEQPKDTRLKLFRIELNKGYVGGINFGLLECEKRGSDYILILNNDTLIDRQAIGELVSTCNLFNKKAIVTGKVYHYNHPDKLQDIGYNYVDKQALKFNRIGLNEIDNGQYEKVCERDMLDDVFWLFSTNLYKKIGGYSPYFWFNGEQADFALRAKKEGYKLVYTPYAKLWHKGSVSIGGRDRNPKLAYWHIQSTLIFRYRHLSKSQFIRQYFLVVKQIIASYLKTIMAKIEGRNINFNYPKAKFKGLLYFNKWLIIRNENTGYFPFKDN